MKYTFEDLNTEQLYEVDWSYSELQEFLKDKPEHIVQRFSMTIGDAVRLGVKKPPADFQKYVLGPLHEKVGKQSKIKDSKFQIPREW